MVPKGPKAPWVTVSTVPEIGHGYLRGSRAIGNHRIRALGYPYLFDFECCIKVPGGPKISRKHD